MPELLVMIELSSVGKTFRSGAGPGRKGRVVTAVRDVSLSLEAGLVVGIVGPNGAGKTTLLGLLLGFLEATSGSISIDGLEPRSYVRRHGASYLPERFQLSREWKVRAALRALLSLDGSAHHLDALMDRFELNAVAGAAALTLSRGTMQRVGIAQAVAAPRRLMVLDEPTEGLDPVWRVRFRETLRALRSADRTILIASHDLAEMERLADRVLILNDGTITETVELRPQPGQPSDYTIVLKTPHAAMATLFADARESADASYTVTVADAEDLSARLAALLESGATIVSINPTAALEQRVTRVAQPERL
jgi:ABC-type multidrug transport system ATPase subunit